MASLAISALMKISPAVSIIASLPSHNFLLVFPFRLLDLIAYRTSY